MILVRDRSVRARAMSIATACSMALKEPVQCNDLEFFTTPSIGVSMFPDDGKDMEALLKHADTAMSQAKSTGISEPVLYTEAMSARLRDWHDLESRLRRAVRDELLDVRFQPKFRLHDNRIVGVEALARWYDEKHGEISPNRFVHIAEESGLIIDLGAWIVRTVCRQLRAWLDRGIAMPIAINISGKDMVYGDPARLIEEQLGRCRLPRSYWRSRSPNPCSSATRAQVAATCRGCGNWDAESHLMISGPASPLWAISRGFPRTGSRSTEALSTTSTVPQVTPQSSMRSCHWRSSLDLKVTAEGVERQGQLEWLRACGCHEGQGFLLARPMAAAAVEKEFFSKDEQPYAPQGLFRA